MTESPGLWGGLRTKAVPQQPKILAASRITIFVARVLPHCAHFHHWEIILVVGPDPVFIYFSGRKNTLRKRRRGWNFDLNASFGKTEAQTSLQRCRLDGQSVVPPAQGFAPGICPGSKRGALECRCCSRPRSPEPRQRHGVHVLSSQHRW